ncbi:hypothetical protein KAT36_03655 [Candidatus Pacearchaeota archaeon]|nr:hypothetical protein [Candidatus Pacearchaeota archaeon]
MKPEYVYHGTTNGKIKIFEPRVPNDIGGNKHNEHKGIYATKLKRWAMVMGILSGKGVLCSRIDIKPKIKGIIFGGKPQHKYFYVYTFESAKFKNIPTNGHQYICREKIVPLKVERFMVKDYIKWIRNANEEEMKNLMNIIKKRKLKVNLG